jgi:nitrous oxidase accessory protein NosD
MTTSRTARTAAALATAAVAALAPLVLALPAHAADPATLTGGGRALVLRPHLVQVVDGDRLLRTIQIPPGEVTLPELAAAVGDPTYLRASHGIVELEASILQRPGTVLVVASPVRTVILGGPAATPATLQGTDAAVTFSGIAVRTSAPTRGASLPRSYVRYTNGSRVFVTGSSFSGLGTTGSTVRSGFSVEGSLVSITHSSFQHGATGLLADRVADLTVDDVTASANAEDGVVVRDVTSARVTSVTASGNGGDGVVLATAGPSWSVHTLVADANRGAGVLVRGGDHAQVTQVRTSANGTAGVVLHACAQCTLTAASAADEPVGVDVSGAPQATLTDVQAVEVASGVVLDRAADQATVTGAVVDRATLAGVTVAGTKDHIVGGEFTDCGIGVSLSASARDALVQGSTVTGADTGVRIPAGATGSRVDGVSIRSASSAGVAVGATGVDVGQVRIDQSQVGVWLYGTGTGLLVHDSTVTGPVDGVVAAAGTGTLQLTNVHVTGGTGAGVSSAAHDVTVSNSTVSGAFAAAVELKGRGELDRVQVTGAATGVRVAPKVAATITMSTLSATQVGLVAMPGSTVVLDHSRVDAPRAIKGKVTVRNDSHVSPLPMHWLGIAALGAVFMALFLESLRRMREHERDRTVAAPEHVMNRA